MLTGRVTRSPAGTAPNRAPNSFPNAATKPASNRSVSAPTAAAAAFATDGGPGTGAGLVSGDAVALDTRVARAGSRAVARGLDLLISLVIAGIGWLAIGIVDLNGGGMDTALLVALQITVAVVALVVFPVWWETAGRGRTPGKAAMGLRAVREDGGPITFLHALTRTMVGLTAEWPGLLPPFTWIASLSCMVANPQGRRIGDIAAGTMVIHDRPPVVWGWVPAIPAHLTAWAATLDLTGLGDDLALAVRQFLVRVRFLDKKSAVRIGTALTAEVVGRVRPLPPDGISGRDYLAAVLGERHRRSVSRLARSRGATVSVWPELARLTGTQTLPGPALPSLPGTPGMPNPALPNLTGTPSPALPGLRPAAPAD